MPNPTRVYWDACVWISLLNGHPDRVTNCLELLRRARAGEFEIWTSSLSLAEVFRAKCDGDVLEAEISKDATFEDYLLQEFVQEVQVDHDIGIAARRLMRRHPGIRPADAIHLATAAAHNVREFHTYDGGLLARSEQLACTDGTAMRIVQPPPPLEPELPLADVETAGIRENSVPPELP